MGWLGSSRSLARRAHTVKWIRNYLLIRSYQAAGLGAATVEYIRRNLLVSRFGIDVDIFTAL